MEMKWVFISDKYRGKVILSFPCSNEVEQKAAEPYDSQHMCYNDLVEMLNNMGLGHGEYKDYISNYADFIRPTVSRFYVDVVVPLK